MTLLELTKNIDQKIIINFDLVYAIEPTSINTTKIFKEKNSLSFYEVEEHIQTIEKMLAEMGVFVKRAYVPNKEIFTAQPHNPPNES